MAETRFGVLVVVVYSLVTQVMLINLLIAMMGDTYGTVKQNSDREWKFYRYKLIKDYNVYADFPPPLNLIHLIANLFSSAKGKNVEGAPKEFIEKIMKTATEKVIEQEEQKVQTELPAVSVALREHLRLLSTQRDSDRIYIEEQMEKIKNISKKRNLKMEALEDKLIHLEEKIDAILQMQLNNSPNNPV